MVVSRRDIGYDQSSSSCDSHDEGEESKSLMNKSMKLFKQKILREEEEERVESHKHENDQKSKVSLRVKVNNEQLNPELYNNYREYFEHLLLKDIVDSNAVVRGVLSNNSQKMMFLTMTSHRRYDIFLYDIFTKRIVLEEAIGGNEDDYMKAKEIEQNKEGTKFAVPYNNDGVYFLRLVDQNQNQKNTKRRQKDIDRSTVNLSKLSGLKT